MVPTIAVISQPVTKGFDPNATMKDSGVAWLGKVPEPWEVRPLGALVRDGTSFTYGIVQAGQIFQVEFLTSVSAATRPVFRRGC